MRSSQKRARLEEEVNEIDYDFEAKPTQLLRIIGHTISCRNCLKELAAFYCPCGCFLCAFDMVAHKCLIALKENFSDDLKKALR